MSNKIVTNHFNFFKKPNKRNLLESEPIIYLKSELTLEARDKTLDAGVEQESKNPLFAHQRF